MTARTKSLPHLPTDQDVARLVNEPTSDETIASATREYARMLLRFDENIRGWRREALLADWRKIGLGAFSIYMELRDVNPEQARRIVAHLWPLGGP